MVKGDMDEKDLAARIHINQMTTCFALAGVQIAATRRSAHITVKAFESFLKASKGKS